MAWIKRNLVFVISMAVGILLAGAAGYFAYTAIDANTDAQAQFTAAAGDLTTIQGKTPRVTAENIKIANDDSARVAKLVKDLGASFVNFPAPPNVDPREFKRLLTTDLEEFRAKMTNANVGLLSPDYAFAFTAQASSLSFNEAAFGPWLQELEEIRAILDILAAAKINSLDQLQRAAVPGEDPTGTDYVGTPITSNQVAVISPYKIAFRGFSEEVANVLRGFAQSGHCFLIKDIQVTSSKNVSQPGGGFQMQMPPPMSTMAPNQPVYMPRGNRPGFGGPGMREMGRSPMPQPPPQAPMVVAAPAVPTGPMTILRPMPLFVTMVIDVVKLKNTH